MRSRYIWVSSRQVKRPASSPEWIPAMVSSSTRKSWAPDGAEIAAEAQATQRVVFMGADYPSKRLTRMPLRIYKNTVHHVRSCPFRREPPLVVVRLNGLAFLSF